jgi:hypothetical protein
MIFDKYDNSVAEGPHSEEGDTNITDITYKPLKGLVRRPSLSVGTYQQNSNFLLTRAAKFND